MRSRNWAPFAWLLRKEMRELAASRSWWIMLALVGPLVGVSFISAVRTYAELSGLNGTSAGVGQAFSPLIGVWGPTFGACEIAAAFLLPFVAIRVVAGDRQSGALKLELQRAMSPLARVAAKTIVLLAAWLTAMTAPIIAVLLWRAYGGAVYPPEIATAALGHVLNAGLTIALAAAAASVTEHPSTAAIATLGVTVGTWIISFIAAVQGGIWSRVAEYTPTSLVAAFQHGLIRLDVTLIAVLLIGAGVGFAAVWMRLGVPVRRRLRESLALAAATAAAIAACTFVFASWDLSEARVNSFSEADEQALRSIRGPIGIEAHLAPEDPRRVDLEDRTIAKLRRVVPRLQVQYISNTSTGLFEQTASHYGEIWYEIGGRRTMSRSTTVDGVLETIFSLAGLGEPAENDDGFRGHPLAVPPRGAAAVFYGIWPATIIVAAVLAGRR